MAAFEHAAELGADGVELDVRRTADGVLVIHHDALIAGRPIVTINRDELAGVAPHIPDLTEAVAACTGMWIDIEVKNDPADPDWDPGATVAARVAVEFSGRTDLLVSSFDRASVVGAVEKGMRAGLVLDHGSDPLDSLDAVAGIEMLFPPITSMRGDRAEAVITAAAAAGIEIGVWWTDDPEEMRRLGKAGVGVVFTNVPDVARAVFG